METEDVFRQNYRALSPAEIEALKQIKEKAMELYELYQTLAGRSAASREAALAKTNLEQSVMWATKAITA